MPALNQAVVNNAQWCDAVCRAHAAPGHFAPSAWVNTNNTPPLYPNMVTTDDDVASQVRAVEMLIEMRAEFPHAVKDSFHNLERLGFLQLFSAQWYAANHPLPQNIFARASDWQRLTTASDLIRWEQAWRFAGDCEDILQTTMFPAQLLSEPGVLFLACNPSNTIAAGAIAYEASGVIGITNFFSKPEDRANQFAGCLNYLHSGHPQATVVGYEHAHILSGFSGHNLQHLGPLRVWLR